MTYDVFISYSRRDTKVADKVCKALSEAGISCFIDRVGISAGVSFTDVITKAIDESSVFLFLGSSNSYRSKFTVAEVFYAFNHKQPGSIIPYLLDDAAMPAQLEFILGTTNWLRMKEHPIGPSLIKAIRFALRRSNPEVYTPKKAFRWLLVIVPLLLVAGIAAAAYYFHVRNLPTEESRALADHEKYETLVSGANSMISQMLVLENNRNTPETTDSLTSYLQNALAELDKAESTAANYAGTAYASLFSENTDSLRTFSQEKLNSIFTYWKDFTLKSYDFYKKVHDPEEAETTVKCAEHALKIRGDQELESIIKDLNSGLR